LGEQERAIDLESGRRSRVELRHRNEPKRITKLLDDAVHVLADSAKNYCLEEDDDKKKLILFNRKFANEDLKSAKLTAEILEKIQNMERKSSRLDSKEDNQGSDLVARITSARKRIENVEF
jgi:hypothetical protein